MLPWTRQAGGTYQSGGRHWDFWFCGFGYILDRFFGFGVRCGLRIFRILAFGFSVFAKNIDGFPDLIGLV